MASFASRTGQKIKEWWGAKVTVDPQLETKKQRINEIDQYIKGLSQSFSNISALFQQMHGHMGRISQISQKLFEKETDTNKRIGIEVTSMFGNLSELFRSKTEPTSDLNKNYGEWFQTIETLKIQLINFSEIRLVYDHYKLKVEELEKDRSNTLSKGQPEDFKLSEKIRRNQSKLSSSESNYKQKLSEILNNMNKLLGNYYRMINQSLDSFITINYDLYMNAKSILKKNQKAFNKFKYPELEPIIDLLREQKEMSTLLEREQLKEKEIQKEKEQKEKEKEKEKNVNEKDDKQQQQGPQQQNSQWEGNNKFNPFGQSQQMNSQTHSIINNTQVVNSMVNNPQMINPMINSQTDFGSGFGVNTIPKQQQFINPIISQRQSMQQQGINNNFVNNFPPNQNRVDMFDDVGFQMMSDLRTSQVNAWQQQQQQQQYGQSQIIQQNNFINNNPFMSQQPLNQKSSLQQNYGFQQFDPQNNRAQQPNPFADLNNEVQKRAMYDNPYTYNQQFQDNQKTNPFE
ncbi:unnamed protein product [Paramecium primaurelia]|uniref:AH domain-containing protein n=1 Tax=Paramecium primaurelia TaxID=5886 RepID=A0A8S1LN85_PARPR|nr:unnamed protein product [Paramecium primaurelia]